MVLAAGTRLGPYEIVAALGAGGMGEVYRAEDTNLQRHVAIKVLPDESSHDPERLARFQREAQVLASLSHPNIATLYGLEESNGKRFIVMELVEGQTLAHRLLRGPLPVDEALEVCRQIAEGLEAAHEKGVIHRDLKPGNVMLTPNDKVKILDFGLARVFHDQPSDADMTHSPTITEAMTRAGTILGTAAYMSPEQAKGKSVDRRADIWAFGCVLYECLTGKRAFHGETVTETIASILTSEPDWVGLSAVLPARVVELLYRCLQKDPRERLHDIADARIQLERPFSTAADSPATSSKRLPWKTVAVTSAIALFCFLLGMVLTRYLLYSPERPVQVSTIKVNEGWFLEGSRWDSFRPTRTAVALTPDAKSIVYCGAAQKGDSFSRPMLFLRRLDNPNADPITGTEGGIAPFLSPDGRWLGFWVGATLMKVAIEGGTAQPLGEFPWQYGPMQWGASWGMDGTIVFAPYEGGGLFRIPAQGGKAEVLTTPNRERREFSHRLPFWLPNATGILFTIMRFSRDPEPQVAVLDVRTGSHRLLMEDVADARYVPTGHLVFVRKGACWAVSFDLEKMETRGRPVPAPPADVMQALNTINTFHNSAAAQFAFSASGDLVYVDGGVFPEPQAVLVWLDHAGKESPVTDTVFSYGAPRISPNGRLVAFGLFGRALSIGIYDFERGLESRWPSGLTTRVVWTPDGKRVAFDRMSPEGNSICMQSFDGSPPAVALTAGLSCPHPSSWSADETCWHSWNTSLRTLSRTLTSFCCTLMAGGFRRS